NCRFSVLTTDGNTKVAHVAGTLNSGKRRDTEEINAGFCTAETKTRARRLSIAGATVHGYAGQTGDVNTSSSAFVFGRREGTEWSFYSQIVKGVMNLDTFLKTATAPRDVAILASHRQI